MTSHSTSTADNEQINAAAPKSKTGTVPIRKAAPSGSMPPPGAPTRGSTGHTQDHTFSATTQTLPKNRTYPPPAQGVRTVSPTQQPRAGQRQPSRQGQTQRSNARNSSTSSQLGKKRGFEVIPAPITQEGQRPSPKTGLLFDGVKEVQKKYYASQVKC